MNKLKINRNEILKQVQEDKHIKHAAFTLAEGVTHVVSLPNKDKGFTLAEVLITLGIIGIVAVMTIPTLIANTRSQQYRAQFKKTLSTINQAVKMADAQYNFNFSNLTDSLDSNLPSCEEQNPQQYQTICSLINGTLTGAKFLGTINDNEQLQKAYVDIDLIGGGDFEDFYFWQLADGSIFGADNSGAATLGGKPATMLNIGFNGARAMIDVNGLSKPNKGVHCNNPDDEKYADEIQDTDSNECFVDNAHIGDVFNLCYYDSTIIPCTNADLYVLHTTK